MDANKSIEVLDTSTLGLEELINVVRTNKKVQNGEAVVDAKHLSAEDLTKFRLSDCFSRPGFRKDNCFYNVILEPGAMKGAILAGFGENIDQHDLVRCFDMITGGSAGATGACAIATKSSSKAAEAQRHIANKPFYKLNPLQRYISPVIFALGLGPLLNGQHLKDSFDYFHPLTEPFQVPVQIVVSKYKKATQSLYSAFVDITNKTPEFRQWARWLSMNVPLFMSEPTDDEEMAYDAAGSPDGSMPTQKCVSENGATHLLILRTNAHEDEAQMSVVGYGLKELGRFSGVAAEHIFAGVNRMSSSVWGRSQGDKGMINAWLNRKPAKAECSLPSDKVLVMALPKRTVGMLTTNLKTLAENRVAGWKESSTFLRDHFGLITQELPEAWRHDNSSIRQDLGLQPGQPFPVDEIYRRVTSAKEVEPFNIIDKTQPVDVQEDQGRAVKNRFRTLFSKKTEQPQPVDIFEHPGQSDNHIDFD